MNTLIIATSRKPQDLEEEMNAGKRPRLDYFELCKRLGARFMDYDPPYMHSHQKVRKAEEKLRLDIFWARDIARKIKKEGFKTVFCMSERIGIPLSLFIRDQVKQVVTIHKSMAASKLWLMRAVRAQKYWDAIFAYSEIEAQALCKKLHVDSERITVLRTPVDTSFYTCEPENNIPEAEFLLSLGLSNRDYPTLIQAMRQLDHVTCEISATSAWVKHKAGYEDEVLPGNVLIKSYDHPYVIRDAYARCRFLVLPIVAGTSQWSAGSSTILEAQAMGKPVIATNSPGLSNYVIDGETGFLVEAGNPDDMAEKIEYLWRHPGKAKLMGQRASEWVQSRFSIDRWVAEVAAVLTAV